MAKYSGSHLVSKQWGTAYNLTTKTFPIPFGTVIAALSTGFSYGAGSNDDGAPRIRSLHNDHILCGTGFSSDDPSYFSYFIAIGIA